MAVELEFYFVDRERTSRPRAAARQPLSGRREDKTQINSMAELDEYSAVLMAIDEAARAQDLPAAPCWPNTARVSSSEPAPRGRCPARLRPRHPLKRLVKGVPCARARRDVHAQAYRDTPAAARTCT